MAHCAIFLVNSSRIRSRLSQQVGHNKQAQTYTPDCQTEYKWFSQISNPPDCY
jgi:hypothetical protein